jgi:hypothetical protein
LPVEQSPSTAHVVGHDFEVPLHTYAPHAAGAVVDASALQLPDALHASQPSLHAASQQTPFAQWPLAHTASDEHVPPSDFGVPQIPPAHVAGAVHPVLAVHDVVHAVVPQTNGAHACVVAAGQCPTPSHVAASVCVPPEQAALLQDVVATGYLQTPLVHVPPHAVPSFAQGSPAGGVPLIAVQLPTEPVSVHD